MAMSASRFTTSTAISSSAATPAEASTGWANRREKASVSDPATNSANELVVTRRSCSGRPWPARTAACASAPSATICDATGSSFTPAVVSDIVAPLRVISWSPRCWRSAVSAWETAGSLTFSILAASLTDPSRATITKALS